MIPAPTGDAAGRRPGWRWAVVAGLAGVAASTLATSLAAAVAGRQSDLALQPVELALRVGLLLVAPCVGALLAAVVVPVPSAGGRLAVTAVALGVPVGPLLVLRLDRIRQFGLVASLLTLGVMVAWGVVGAALAAGWWSRPGRHVQRTDLPLVPGFAEPDPPPRRAEEPGPAPRRVEGPGPEPQRVREPGPGGPAG